MKCRRRKEAFRGEDVEVRERLYATGWAKRGPVGLNDHTASLGACEIPRRDYLNYLNQMRLGRLPKTFILVVKTSTVVPRNYSAIVRGAFD